MLITHTEFNSNGELKRERETESEKKMVDVWLTNNVKWTNEKSN